MKDLGGLDDSARLALAHALIARLDGAPFGTVPKRELDVALFAGLVDAGYISDADPVFVTARKLEITPGRVKSLLYSYRMAQDTGPGFERMLAAVRMVSIARGGDAVLNVEDAYWRDAFVARLKEVGVFTDRSFNSERVVLDADQFLDAFDDAFGNDGADAKARIEALLAEDDLEGRVAFVRGVALRALGEMGMAAAKALLA
ncbi:hypothetical protein [Demequina zhanjiangensis]|uniref:Uncharacterized protein n=1 Tax=Demequina zhanjiangensis TaxID=3051659 RepID=A0ABT8G2L7_9MICO|nr:hypothetical protein [Demequina sp. SYSU T00b26]MDN4473383.1 hypothetical protein [Demequina sp. SYSU T00b26]